MRDLQIFKEAVKSTVETHVYDNIGEETYISKEIDVDFEIDGVEYSATVSVDAELSFDECFESDKFGIDVYAGQDAEIKRLNIDFKEIWDYEIEDYIIMDYKQTDKW